MQTYCATPGCAAIVPKGRCAIHAAQQEHQRNNYDARRWYRQAKWKRLRALVIFEQANKCSACGLVTMELDVDHIEKHCSDQQKFFDRSNLSAMCRPCHSRKTQKGL